MPRAREADESVAVRVTVGSLAKGARIMVKTSDGEVAGTVVPFGVLPGQPPGAFMVPVPLKAVKDGKLTLHFEVEEKSGGATRPPTKEEVRAAELVLVPVSGTPE